MTSIYEQCFTAKRVPDKDQSGVPGWLTTCKFCDFSMTPQQFSSLTAFDHAERHKQQGDFHA
jgi:hypothetical protein